MRSVRKAVSWETGLVWWGFGGGVSDSSGIRCIESKIPRHFALTRQTATTYSTGISR